MDKKKIMQDAKQKKNTYTCIQKPVYICHKYKKKLLNYKLHIWGRNLSRLVWGAKSQQTNLKLHLETVKNFLF